jgi:hypothetical protein
LVALLSKGDRGNFSKAEIAAALGQCPANLTKKVLQQSVGILERAGRPGWFSVQCQ